MRVFVLAAVVSCLHGVAIGDVGTNYPNPASNPRACGNGSPSWVCDPDDMLMGSQARDIDAELKKIHALQNVCICKHCPSSMGVGVALKRKVHFTYERTKETYEEQKEFAVFSLAHNLRIHEWTFLKGECLNSAVLLVTGDGEFEFSVGRDATHTLKYKCRTKVEEIGKKYASSGDYFRAIMESLKLIRTSLATKSDCDSSTGTGGSPSTSFPIIIGVVVSVVLIIAFVMVCAIIIIKRQRMRRMGAQNTRLSFGPTYHHASGGVQVGVGAQPQPYYPSQPASGALLPPQYQPHYPEPSAPPQGHYSAPPPSYPAAKGSLLY